MTGISKGIEKLVLLAVSLTMISVGLLATKRVEAQVVTLDFEDFPAGTHLTTQYSGQGVLFPSGGFIDEDPAARSGTRVLRAANPTAEFHAGPFVIRFISGQSLVRFFAGTTTLNPIPGTLRAFDGEGNVIAQDGPKTVAPKIFTTPFEVSVAAPSILRIEIEMGTTEFESLDDLHIEGEAPPPLPTEPPVVQITSPVDNARLEVSSLSVQGTVAGDELFLATLKFEPPRLPESHAPIFFRFPLPLSGAGTTRTFDHTQTIGIGQYRFTAEAENIAGLKGSASVRITNIPEAIHARFLAEGGSSTFGELIFGLIEGNCKVAIYERGAIAVEGGTTRIVTGEIFDKWIETRDPFDQIILGCPASEERSAPGDARAQDFKNGRIYAGLPTGAHYVPSVFVQAIDSLGGDRATGVPISDPTRSLPLRTWLFQQFMRPDFPELLPSTLEIVGDPPKLRVERQGDDLSLLFFEDSEVLLTDKPATVWREFPCSSPSGPCAVSTPRSASPIENAGEVFCQGKKYPKPPPELGGPKEWPPVVGDFVLTPILGFAKNFHLAGKDNPLTHECKAAGLLDLYPSDLNVFVRPIHPFRNLFADNRSIVELEFEHCWFAFGFGASWGSRFEPVPGDLLFASGRWVIDCGHEPYNSEIHPPAVMVSMRTGEQDGAPATQANVWVNEVYTGDPVEFEIWPPPRPSPDAIMGLVRTARDGLDVALEHTFTYDSPVRIRITSPSIRHVEVTSHGEMKREEGRVYWGQWHVYWSE